MKFKIEKFLHVSNDLSPEKQAEVARLLEEKMVGGIQNLTGTLRDQISSDFLAIFHPERVKQLEEDMKRLHSIKGYKKFRAELVLMMMDVFIGGLMSDDDDKKVVRDTLKKYDATISERPLPPK